MSCSIFSLPQEITLGIFSGLLIHPDLDVDKGARHLHLLRKNLGSGIAVIYHAFWRAYALDQKHRGVKIFKWQVSHVPVIGTIDRIAHIFAGARLPSLAILIMIFLFVDQIDLVSLTCFIFGLSISDTVHIGMDFASTFLKKVKKMRR